MDIKDLVKDRILVLDGGMGTMIQPYKLEESDFRGEEFKNVDQLLKGNNDILSITRPDIISAVHEAYLEAGADIIETNTFSGTSIAQADYGLEAAVYDINYQSAQLAKKACEKYTLKNPKQPRFVAGSIGPTNRTASLSPDVNRPGFRNIDFDTLTQAYEEQVAALMDGGVDVLLVETVFDTLNAKSALMAIDNVFASKGKKLPVMISGTITDASGRTLSGQTTEAFVTSLQHVEPLSIGLNCALGAEMMLPYLRIIRNRFKGYVSAHPNAGLPNEMGEYDEGPEQMGQQIQTYLEEGVVDIIGGCCGTTPAHIKKIKELTLKYPK